MAAPNAIGALTLTTLTAALLMLPASLARANGAFPESLQILLPADRPQQIVLSTNFGLIISDDNGATWTWTCEQAQTAMGSLYAVGPAPRDRFYSMSSLLGLAYSDDDSCSWHTAGGTLDRAITNDFFADPSDPNHVLATGSVAGDGGSTAQLFPSDDGGTTFKDALFTAPPGGNLSGVEIARTDPKLIYLAMYTMPGLHPRLVRSTDAGATWTTVDVESMLGANGFRIVAVDPVDAKIIYVRVIEPSSESLAVSRDGGDTFAKVVSVPNGVLTAFARLASGTVLVVGAAGVDAVGFRSSDGGVSFQPWTGVPHLRALAERDGKLYGAAKNFTDGWAIGVSTDEGLTFQPMATYDKVRAIRACAQAVCQDSCDNQAGNALWSADVCHPGASDGGTPPPPKKSGCGCGLGQAGGTGGLGLAVALAALLAARARRRR